MRGRFEFSGGWYARSGVKKIPKKPTGPLRKRPNRLKNATVVCGMQQNRAPIDDPFADP